MDKERKVFEDIHEFIGYIQTQSVKETLMDLGYFTSEDFYGSKICCLFHNEKTPSLQINDYFFKCYGCNAKGDLIKFIQLKDNLTFTETIEKLAKHFNCEIKSNNFGAFNSKKKKLNDEWIKYRNDLKEIIKSNNEKSNWIKGQIKSFLPLEIGYDKNYDYLVLPMTSKQGDIIGFTKRRVDYPFINKNKPKWVHSDSKNSLINECSNIFNLYGSLETIRETKELYLTEGPRDVSAMLNAGFKNTVAVCGVGNFNDKVFNQLSPIKNINFAFDGDSAGKDGIINVFNWLCKNAPEVSINSNVIEFPENKDPYDYSIDNDIRELESRKVNIIDWLVKTAKNDTLIKILNETKSERVSDKIMYSYMKYNGVSYSYAEEILKNKKEANSESSAENDYKERLLATIGKVKDINIFPINGMSEDKAIKILKMRYGINI